VEESEEKSRLEELTCIEKELESMALDVIKIVHD
jgi:hypothetical protein